MDAVIDAAILRTALIDYRADALRMLNKYPEQFGKTAPDAIASIDAALLAIEGNITTVRLTPNTCNPNR